MVFEWEVSNTSTGNSEIWDRLYPPKLEKYSLVPIGIPPRGGDPEDPNRHDKGIGFGKAATQTSI